MSNPTPHIIKYISSSKGYYIDEQGPFKKSVLVHAFIKQYITDNPLNYDKIKSIFTDDLIEKKYKQKGLICTKQEYTEWKATSKKGRYFIDNGTLRSIDGTEFYVNTQWTKDSFRNILELAKELGYIIISDSITNTDYDNETICELPSNYDINSGLRKNLLNAILEYAEILENYNNNEKYTKTQQQINNNASTIYILKKYYGEGKKCKEIALEKGCTTTYIEQKRSEIVNKILSGDIFFGNCNYRLNQGLYDTIQSLKSECLFSTIKKIEIYTRTTDNALLRAIDLDILNINNNIDNTEVAIINPKETKGLYTCVWKIIKDVLLENPLPTDKDVIEKLILEKFADDKKDTYKFKDKEEVYLFVEKILECEELIETKENNRIQIKYNYLNSAAQRIARIVYEATAYGDKSGITNKEIKQHYFSIHSSCKQLNISSAKKFGVCCEGKCGKWYYGEPKVPLQQKIREYAEEKITFFYDEIEEYIKNNGYSLLDSLRVYITNICSVDKDDKNHFCHKDYVDDYNEFKWKEQPKYGWTNWLYNEIRNIFENDKTEELQIAKLVRELEERSRNTEYSNIRKRFLYNITTYCNDDKPFTIKDKDIIINHNVYNNTDFEIIGLRGEKHAFYKQIRSLVANETKKAEQGRIALVEIIHLVNKYVDKAIGRGTIIKAIEDQNKRFAPINIKLVNENGTIYAIWNGQSAPYEPTYAISSTSEHPEVQKIVKTENQFNEHFDIKYRQQINWNDLCETLKKELGFYGKWMLTENIVLYDAVENFMEFLKTSKNKNLNTQLPLDLYEYWFACTDCNDRYRYLIDILIMFEGMLGEMYYTYHGKKCIKYGLKELAKEFEGLSELFLYSRDSKGFKRIACSLQRNRNIVAHGEHLDMSSATMAQHITDYVALYIYTFAKYRVKLSEWH